MTPEIFLANLNSADCAGVAVEPQPAIGAAELRLSLRLGVMSRKRLRRIRIVGLS